MTIKELRKRLREHWHGFMKQTIGQQWIKELLQTNSTSNKRTDCFKKIR